MCGSLSVCLSVCVCVWHSNEVHLAEVTERLAPKCVCACVCFPLVAFVVKVLQHKPKKKLFKCTQDFFIFFCCIIDVGFAAERRKVLPSANSRMFSEALPTAYGFLKQDCELLFEIFRENSEVLFIVFNAL